MGAADTIQVEDALDELVNQFADPMSFFRELIQNALDAGSPEVDVFVDFECDEDDPSAPGAEGVLVVRVDDYGEGMDKEIIDKRLTRLFSSAKDGDKTKIGKFGIGFVSVFAIDPHAVCVDTSRAGEHWRVLFDEQRNFTRLRLDAPVDGTKVTVYKPMNRAEFERFEARAREVVSYWCKHTRGEVRYQDETINRPFSFLGAAGAVAEVDHDDGFSRVVVAHLPGHETFHGFYNQGLTLAEMQEADAELGAFDGLAFKISSPHLEHTLTRDTVIRDRSFLRVVDQLERAVEGTLCDTVFGRLGGALDGTEDLDSTAQALHAMADAAAWHLHRDHRGLVRHAKAFVALSPDGRALTLDAIRADTRQHGALLVAGARSHVTDALAATGRTVVYAPPKSAWLRLAQAAAGGKIAGVWEHVASPRAPEVLEQARWTPLRGATEFLLRGFGAKVQGVALGHFDYRESPIRAHVAISQAQFGELTPIAEIGRLGRGFFERRRLLVLNADHPTVRLLVDLARDEPEFAAYKLVKLFLLGDELDPERDGQLARLTMEQRCRRSNV